jgi:superfamily II DNA helicase RecQ
MTMNEPYLYKQRANQVIYFVQSKLGAHMPDDLRHDIHSNIYHAVIDEAEHARERGDYWRQEYHDLKAKGYPLKWNELRIKLARMRTEAADEVLELMRRLDEEESIR